MRTNQKMEGGNDFREDFKKRAGFKSAQRVD